MLAFAIAVIPVGGHLVLSGLQVAQINMPVNPKMIKKETRLRDELTNEGVAHAVAAFDTYKNAQDLLQSLSETLRVMTIASVLIIAQTMPKLFRNQGSAEIVATILAFTILLVVLALTHVIPHILNKRTANATEHKVGIGGTKAYLDQMDLFFRDRGPNRVGWFTRLSRSALAWALLFVGIVFCYYFFIVD